MRTWFLFLVITAQVAWASPRRWTLREEPLSHIVWNTLRVLPENGSEFLIQEVLSVNGDLCAQGSFDLGHEFLCTDIHKFATIGTDVDLKTQTSKMIVAKLSQRWDSVLIHKAIRQLLGVSGERSLLIETCSPSCQPVALSTKDSESLFGGATIRIHSLETPDLVFYQASKSTFSTITSLFGFPVDWTIEQKADAPEGLDPDLVNMIVALKASRDMHAQSEMRSSFLQSLLNSLFGSDKEP